MDKWEKLNKRLEEYDKLFGEQERKEQQECKEWSKKFRQKRGQSMDNELEQLVEEQEAMDKLNPVSENGIWSEFAEEGLNEE